MTLKHRKSRVREMTCNPGPSVTWSVHDRLSGFRCSCLIHIKVGSQCGNRGKKKGSRSKCQRGKTPKPGGVKQKRRRFSPVSIATKPRHRKFHGQNMSATSSDERALAVRGAGRTGHVVEEIHQRGKLNLTGVKFNSQGL